MTAEHLAGWVRDPDARARYVEAFRKSDFAAMLNFYKRHDPRPARADAPASPSPAQSQDAGADVPWPQRHGTQRVALERNVAMPRERPNARNRPGAGHFVQQDAADLVTNTMKWWLAMRAAS
jgi:hypothetical protein